jgi:hypothetical protein
LRCLLNGESGGYLPCGQRGVQPSEVGTSVDIQHVVLLTG